MSHEIVNVPPSRHWRDIPQYVKPDAMSPAGRRRWLMSAARVAGLMAAAVAVAWGAWEITRAFQENPRTMPAAAKAVAVKNFRLQTDGRLDRAWLVRALALSKGASLMELDLLQLRDRLLAHGQVSSAALSRSFPDTLEVRITEREPIARLRADVGGDVQTLLVAPDGVTFEGAGFEPDKLESLPWLVPARLTRRNGRIEPIADMKLVTELLDRAQRETPRLYASWRVVSLAGLELDGEITVRTKQGTVVVFNARADLFPQLAKLDTLTDMLAGATAPVARINLALGREVPVSFASPTAVAPVVPAAAPKPGVSFSFFQPKPKT